MWRGYKVRKSLAEYKDAVNEGNTNGFYDDTIKEEDIITNSKVRDQLKERGRFKVVAPSLDPNIEKRGPFR